MPFQKGHNIGRPKGGKNKKTEILEGFIESIVNNDKINTKALQELDKLEGKAFWDILTKLYEYVIPKKHSSEVEQTNYNIDYGQFTKEEILEEIAKYNQ